MDVRGIIFDFDGTLFDSMSIWETAGTDYIESLGLTAEKGLCQKLKTMTLVQSSKYLKEQYKLPFTVEQIIDGINKIVENFYFDRAMPKKNVVTALAQLKEKGIKMCIATLTDRYQIEAALKRCDMSEFFDEIFCCSEVGYGKDQPYIFEFACEKLGINKNQTAVFEDAYYAAKTAKDAGFFVVGVYDKYEKRTQEIETFVDVYIKDFSEINKIFDK